MKLFRECVSFKYDGTPERFSVDVEGVEIDGAVYARVPSGDLQKVGGLLGGDWHTTPEAAKAACAEKLRKIAAAVMVEITKLEATA